VERRSGAGKAGRLRTNGERRGHARGERATAPPVSRCQLEASGFGPVLRASRGSRDFDSQMQTNGTGGPGAFFPHSGRSCAGGHAHLGAGASAGPMPDSIQASWRRATSRRGGPGSPTVRARAKHGFGPGRRLRPPRYQRRCSGRPFFLWRRSAVRAPTRSTAQPGRSRTRFFAFALMLGRSA